MEDQLLETWQIHSRINHYLIDGIEEDEHLKDKVASKGRSAGEQLAHMHNVRLMWLKAAAPELLEGLNKVEKKDAVKRDFLKEQLTASSLAMEALLKKGFAEKRIKGFKPHPSAFLGYIISHESHHRGQIALCLKHSGHPLSKKVGFGMWEWGSR